MLSFFIVPIASKLFLEEIIRKLTDHRALIAKKEHKPQELQKRLGLRCQKKNIKRNLTH